MEQVIIFPYDNKSKPFVEYRNWLKDMEITILGFPEGWSVFNNSEEFQDIRKSTYYENELNNCSLLWIVDSEHELPNDDYIFPLIEKAVKHEKKVFCTRFLNAEEQLKYEEIVPEKNRYIFKHKDCEFKLKYDLEFFSISTPIVLVCGLFENLGKFEIQVKIRDEFLNRGYKICQIGSRLCSDVLGFYSMPTFMFAEDISEKDKILMFNHYLKVKEVNENPDLIIIGVPGGIFPFSQKVIENFGMMMYEISQTINFDCTIFSMPCYDDLSVAKIFSDQAKQMFNYEIDFFIVQNKMIEIMESEVAHKITFLSMPTEFVLDKIGESEQNNIFSLEEKELCKQLVDKIVEKLRSYKKIQLV